MKYERMRASVVVTVRLVFAAALVGTAAGVAAPSPVGAVTPTVSIHMSNTAPDVGQLVTVSGTVAPNRAGQVVTLQRYAKATRTWVTVGRVGLNRYSKYAYGYRPTTPGNQTWRAVFGTAARPMAAFVAYRWRFLSDVYPVDTSSWDDSIESGPRQINGVVYPRSVWISTNLGVVEWYAWDLKTRCTTFRATLGIADDSARDGSAALSVLADAIRRFDGVFALGQARAISVSLSGALRLYLEEGEVSGDGYSVFGTFGNARIRCSW